MQPVSTPLHLACNQLQLFAAWFLSLSALLSVGFLLLIFLLFFIFQLLPVCLLPSFLPTCLLSLFPLCIFSGPFFSLSSVPIVPALTDIKEM